MAYSWIITPDEINDDVWEIKLTITGGVQPYTYTWSASQGGNIGSQIDSSQNTTITAIGTGTYTCVITDAEGNAMGFNEDITG